MLRLAKMESSLTNLAEKEVKFLKYLVELSDDDGKTCQISLSIPFDTAGTNKTNSTWRVKDEGLVRFRSGGCSVAGQFATPLELRLARGNEYGIQLYEFASAILRTINDSGEGYIYQSWCVNFKPGHITWALIE